MIVEDTDFKRCAKHPSQIVTGFCSYCLVERLSNVNAKRNEIVEIPTSSVNESKSNGSEVRVRKTLLSLFQLDDSNECEPQTSTSTSTNDLDSLGSKNSKMKTSSFRSNSVSHAKGLRWRFRGSSKSGRFESNSEINGSNKDTIDKPRHSCDGSIMTKALTCSFPCLDEPDEGSSCKRREHKESAVNESNTQVDANSNSNSLNNSSLGSLFGERHLEESSQEMHRDEKKSHRWSRVWDWSITSPFKDFTKKKEHNLERSLSGTWQEANVHHASRANQGIHRNVRGSNGEVQKFRADSQWNKYRFGRSRSVHYPSPGNFDNGLLRFYLTPMRSSRRSSNHGRIRSTGLFTRGILGH